MNTYGRRTNNCQRNNNTENIGEHHHLCRLNNGFGAISLVDRMDENRKYGCWIMSEKMKPSHIPSQILSWVHGDRFATKQPPVNPCSGRWQSGDALVDQDNSHGQNKIWPAKHPGLVGVVTVTRTRTRPNEAHTVLYFTTSMHMQNSQ
jgi:hypothetical protein